MNDSTPSKQVDAVYHTHLLYTRSYQRFCAAALGRPGGFIHHDPSPGGPAAAARWKAQYASTLRLYAAAFQQPPPADVWPCRKALAQQLPPAGAAAELAKQQKKNPWAKFLENAGAILPCSALAHDPALDTDLVELVQGKTLHDLVNAGSAGAPPSSLLTTELLLAAQQFGCNT